MTAETCACGAPLDDGEGYDGRCGNCADRAENAAEKKCQAVIDTLRWLGYTASSELLERNPSWQTHFESFLSNKVNEMTDEQRLVIWPHWTER